MNQTYNLNKQEFKEKAFKIDMVFEQLEATVYVDELTKNKAFWKLAEFSDHIIHKAVKQIDTNGVEVDMGWINQDGDMYRTVTITRTTRLMTNEERLENKYPELYNG